MAGVRATLVVMLVALTLGAPAAARAQSPQPGVTIGIANGVVARTAAAEAPAGGETGGLSDATKQGIGCLAASGATLTYATFVAGATELVMIAAGGLLVPSMTSTLWLGLTATVVATTCALGATATPAVLWAVEQKDNLEANLAWTMRRTEAGVAELFAPSAGSGSRQTDAGVR